MCFPPQRRTLFQHLNFQKCSEPAVLFTLWCPHVLGATAPCAFWTCELPTVLRACGAFCILTSKPASRHSGVQLFSLIWPDGSAPAALASLLFEPPEPQKHSVSRLFSLFAHLHLLSSNSFSSLIFFLLLFSTLTLPTSAFPSIVGILTSKLPSIRWLMVNSQWFYPSPSPMTINLIINVHIISYLYLMANGQ